jgi:hypothetical protein
MIRTTSSEISYQLTDMYSIYRYCWNAATYKWTIHNGKIEINSFGVKKVVSETRRAFLQKFEYTNGATRSRKSKDRQHNGLN